MAIKFDGTTLTNIIYNGVSLGKVIFNGVTVWTKELFIFKQNDKSLSNGCTLKRYKYSGNSNYEFNADTGGTFNVYANGSNGAEYCDVRITTFDITDFDKLEIIAKCNDGNSSNIRTGMTLLDEKGNELEHLIISNSHSKTSNKITTSFKTFTIDISKYSGKLILHLNATIWKSNIWSVFYIKRIRVY